MRNGGGVISRRQAPWPASHSQDCVEVPIDKVVERVVTVPQCTTKEVPVERVLERVVTVPHTAP